MNGIKRRDFIRTAGGCMALAAGSIGFPGVVFGAARRVVVVGGGVGGTKIFLLSFNSNLST